MESGHTRGIPDKKRKKLSRNAQNNVGSDEPGPRFPCSAHEVRPLNADAAAAAGPFLRVWPIALAASSSLSKSCEVFIVRERRS